MTEVGIHNHKKIGGGVMGTGKDCSGQSALGSVPCDQPNSVLSGQRKNLFLGAIGRSVIDKDDLGERDVRLLDLFDQWHDVVDFLQRGDDDGSLHGAGADDGIRTHDLLITNQLLYQLSYVGEREGRRTGRPDALF